MAENYKLTYILANRIVSKVRQEGEVLHLDFTDGSTVQMELADPASSVMVRDKDGKLEYAD